MRDKHPIFGTALDATTDPDLLRLYLLLLQRRLRKVEQGNLNAKLKVVIDSGDRFRKGETIRLLQMFPNHMIIGSSSNRLWKMDDAFDDMIKEYMTAFRDNNINTIILSTSMHV